MIFLVEDNEDDVFLMMRALRRAKITVPMRRVAYGREAMDYLAHVAQKHDTQQFPAPSVILLDIKMPFIHGFEVLDWIKNQDALKAIPVYVISSSLEPGDAEKARNSKANGFFVKPAESEMLAEILGRIPGGQRV